MREENVTWKLRGADWYKFREVIEREEWRVGNYKHSKERDVDELSERRVRKLTVATEEYR